ncbi:hypothetical protein GXW83_31650 [Streptacidiphilus sp. PB12-B1b]|uniref:hypothetical protein n=1 Tax=Streptacidiphilus sp. PB12-B1b TaxID=2705012 RepID=UPI0015F947FA|nr:hypothetical protein [Streptacidiphilus sp. PB12-B1b]QMU79587.1 hypothetical protein GXW83_31650 [Streptacidiphilus sp. PB12-B1b]
MHVHRSRHTCGFMILPNYLLQDRRLSYTARGLLADLLSRPDGWREDGRRMADTSPQGRLAVARALRELTAAGYYCVLRVRQADGTFISEAHVYDTPQTNSQVAPAPTVPVPGGAAADLPGANPVKDLEKEPTLPTPRREAGQRRTVPAAREGGWQAADMATARGAQVPDGPAQRAAETLLRVVGPEPRLRVGTVEAMALAPQVAAWLERGCGERDLGQALLTGLPDRVHSAAALLRDRLVRKLPPVPAPMATSGPAVAPLTECPTCGDPVRQVGTCRTCAGLGSRTVAVGTGEAATRRGAARVRAAMRPTGQRLAPSRASALVW